MKQRMIANLLIFFLALVGCSQTVAPPQTATDVASIDPASTETAVPPTPSPTAEPTATQTGVSTAAPTVTAVPTAAPTAILTEATEQMVHFKLASDPERSFLPTSGGSLVTSELNGTGAVTFHEGQFHMFFNAMQGGWPPQDVAIGYMTSADGLTWTLAADEPVLVGSEAPYDIHAIYASSVVVAEDGTWLLYFHTITGSSAEGEGDAVGVATAPAPTGPWTYHDELLLAPDPEGWDSYALWAPSVVRTDAGYFMYYSGLGPPPHWDRAIGLAISADGLTWTRHGDPVLAASEESDVWDSKRIEQSVVTTSPDGFVMVYRADHGSGNFSGIRTAFGLATSTDGIVWQRVQTDPVLQPGDEAAWSALWSAGLAYANGAYYLFVETEGPYRGTHLYATTYEGPLP